MTLQSARLWVRAVERKRSTHAAASVGLAEADEDAAEAISDFEQIDPPPGTDRLRASLTSLASEATRCWSGVDGAERSETNCRAHAEVLSRLAI